MNNCLATFKVHLRHIIMASVGSASVPSVWSYNTSSLTYTIVMHKIGSENTRNLKSSKGLANSYTGLPKKSYRVKESINEE